MYRGEAMLGYTKYDLMDMLYAIEEGIFYLPPSNHDNTRLNLQKAGDLIEGLMAEGRV
jgi:hypothetical protein